MMALLMYHSPDSNPLNCGQRPWTFRYVGFWELLSRVVVLKICAIHQWPTYAGLALDVIVDVIIAMYMTILIIIQRSHIHSEG